MKSLGLSLALLACPAFADDAVIRAVEVQNTGVGWRFSVTLAHQDTGWDHYTDGWRIEDAGGAVLGVRELAHPHVMEQPFTRSLTGVTLPDGTRTVFIRARCNLDGWSDETQTLDIPLGG